MASESWWRLEFKAGGLSSTLATRYMRGAILGGSHWALHFLLLLIQCDGYRAKDNGRFWTARLPCRRSKNVFL